MSLIFKDVVGKEDKYSVTNDGRVWSKISNKFLKPFKQKNGYLTLYLGAGVKNKKEVHRLVFEAFYRRLLPNEQAHHINQNQNDNRPQNLVAKDASEHASYHNSKRIRTEQSNRKRSEKLKGRTPWNKGLKLKNL